MILSFRHVFQDRNSKQFYLTSTSRNALPSLQKTPTIFFQFFTLFLYFKYSHNEYHTFYPSEHLRAHPVVMAPQGLAKVRAKAASAGQSNACFGELTVNRSKRFFTTYKNVVCFSFIITWNKRKCCNILKSCSTAYKFPTNLLWFTDLLRQGGSRVDVCNTQRSQGKTTHSQAGS